MLRPLVDNRAEVEVEEVLAPMDRQSASLLRPPEAEEIWACWLVEIQSKIFQHLSKTLTLHGAPKGQKW